MELGEPFDERILMQTWSSRFAFAHQWPEAARLGGPLLLGGQCCSDRECLLIETVAVRPLAGVGGPAAPWRGMDHNPHRRRLLGGLAFCLLSLGACALVARHLSDASWPLEGAHAPMVFLAGCSYLAGFGLRAFGWHQLFPSHERPDGARCLAACGAAAASGVVLPFRLDYVVKISTLRRLGGVTLGLETIAVSIIALGMVDAVAMLPLAVSAFALSGPVLRAPLIVVVLFCIGCLGILTLGQRVARLPLVSRSDRLHTVYRRVADSTRFSPPTLVAGLLLLGCWTSRALGSTLLLSALGVRFSPTLALVVLCMSGATSILPVTAGGAVAGMGTTAGVLLALGVSKGVAVNFSLASGLMLTGAALAAAALGLSGSLLLSYRARRPFAAAIPASGFAIAPGTVKRLNNAGTIPTCRRRVEFQTRVTATCQIGPGKG
jgi:hypothetical protein